MCKHGQAAVGQASSPTRLDRALRYWKDKGAHEELAALRAVEEAGRAVIGCDDAPGLTLLGALDALEAAIAKIDAARGWK